MRNHGKHNLDDDSKRQLLSAGDMSALRNIYNISKNTAGTSSNDENAGAELNVQSLLKFCSGYSISDQINNQDHTLKKSFQKDNDFTDK